MRAVHGIIILGLLSIGSRAEMRAWTLRSGGSVQGEYVSVVFDKIVLRNADGQRITFPFDEVSNEDVAYIELANPPELSVDSLKSAEQIFITPSPIWVDNSPVKLLRYTFGARIRQKSVADYDHDLVVEIYAVAQQVYDPDNYHLVYKWKSEPFRLTRENNHRHECRSPKKVDLSEFLLAGEYPRGQKYAECLILVRDERGEVVAFDTTKNWLYENLDKLSALPAGAWFNRSCQRIHPTSPKPVWRD